MTTLREIRKRLQAAGNIKQITKAMELVAAARLHRAQVKAAQTKLYANKMKQIKENIASASIDFVHPLLETRKVQKVGLVVISADRGLCGPYNTNVFAASDLFLKNQAPQQLDLILIGRKAIDYYERRKMPVKYQIPDWVGKTSFSKVKTLANQLITWFLLGELDEIWLIYTHFTSIMNRKVVTEKFLNIDIPKAGGKKKAIANYIFEPNPAEIYAEILPRYLITKIEAALDDAYASELAARILSMRSATKNAEEMIESLTLVRNKVRQTGITKEILEIISGAERLK
ncbi:MAG TPA: ATP synthase F1 subunit gamma [Waddliaceae bacterium]